MGELTRRPGPGHERAPARPQPARQRSRRSPREVRERGGAAQAGGRQAPSWTRLLSQPGEAAERRADARALSALRMPRARPSGAGSVPSTAGGQVVAPAMPRRDHLPAGLPAAVAERAGRGRPLAPAEGTWFAARFGTRFDHVRIHDDDRAAALAEAADARAVTAGSHVFFNRGEYRPGTPAGRSLLAHELAHVEQGDSGGPRLWRKAKGEVILGEPEVNPPAPPEAEEWVRLEVYATGMDHAAQLLAGAGITFKGPAGTRTNVFVGLHPKFVKVYGPDGKALGGRIALKEVKGLRFAPGVYVQGPQGLFALTISPDEKEFGAESSQSVIGQRPFTAAEKAAMAEEAKKAAAEGREPKPAPKPMVNFKDLLTEPDRFRSMVDSVANALVFYFVPTYDTSAAGKGEGESKAVYSSPIEGRRDGKTANAHPWPVSVDGPRLAPIDSDPTYVAKVDWSAYGNYTLTSQVISKVGTTIHYKWELFDVTRYAKQQIAKDPAATRETSGAKPEKTLQQRIDDFKASKAGTGTDVTGMGGANREFSREFEDWWKDTKRAAKGRLDPSGDTVGERLSNAAANQLALELAPVSLLVTAVGAALRWLADLFAGPRQQQEIPLEKEGIFLVRVITTPAISEDTEGKEIVRPPSVDARVVEVTPMDRAVREALDEPGAQLAELQSQIDLAVAAGNTAKAEYLRSLLAEAKLRFEGSPLALLVQQRDKKQKELDEFRKNYPTLSDYSRSREVAELDKQIARYKHHEKVRREDGGAGLPPMQRVNATLISEVTAQQYPLLISAGPMSMQDGRHRWLLSDVTNPSGDSYIGLGATPSAAFKSALTKFGNQAAYGRGRIGARTAGLGLEAGAPAEILVDSAPADWALAEKRIDDLVITLAALGLVVASAGTAGAVIGAGVAAARMIDRWQKGRLSLDAQTVSDVLAVFGGLGAAGQLAAGLRVQKFEKTFAVVREGQATEAQIAAAGQALKGAQQLNRAVELANEALNYGGLIWGNLEFVDQMMAINEQERTGAITHAAARRQRAGAISSAVQNNGLFIAGNVLKAKQQAKAAERPAGKAPVPAEEPAGKRPQERPPARQPEPGEPPVPAEKAPAEKVPPEEAPRKEGEKPAEKVPKTAEQPPLGERRATLDELRAALPSDLRKMLTIDDSGTLQGDEVRAEYDLDKTTGLITEIRLRCSPDARPATVRLHVDTVREMQKYQGFSGRVRQAVSWVADLVGVKSDILNPENRASFEAALEIRKLPKVIEAQMQRMRNLEPDAVRLAEAELASLEVQLDKHLRTLELADAGEGAGYVAAKGLSKAKQKQYAELRAKLRDHLPGSESHKRIRREMYELIGGDLPYESWERVYDSNVKRAIKANKVVAEEHTRLGWGETEQTIPLGRDEVRRIDIADVPNKRGVEVKAYETGYITASEDIVWEVDRDAKLVKRGWEITWLLIDTQPSGPLLQKLLDAGITVEIRVRKGVPTETVTVIAPPPKKKTKAATK